MRQHRFEFRLGELLDEGVEEHEFFESGRSR